jgi:hypothetical protein
MVYCHVREIRLPTFLVNYLPLWLITYLFDRVVINPGRQHDTASSSSPDLRRTCRLYGSGGSIMLRSMSINSVDRPHGVNSWGTRPKDAARKMFYSYKSLQQNQSNWFAVGPSSYIMQVGIYWFFPNPIEIKIFVWMLYDLTQFTNVGVDYRIIKFKFYSNPP